MYVAILFAHSLLRWFVLIGLAVRAAMGAQGWLSGRESGPADKRVGLFTIIALDTQLLLGLLLHLWLSPVTKQAFADMGAAMKDAALRFWAVEHLTLMLLAVVAAHAGYAIAKRGATSVKGHRAAAIGFGIALLLVVIGIPWPFRADIGRAWLMLP